jgi:hypothetical protein
MKISNYLPLTENSGPPPPEDSSRKEDDNLVNLLLEDHLKVLSQILKDVREEMINRIEFKDILIERIDERMCYLMTRLYELDPLLHRPGKIEGHRNEIIAELEGLEREKRDRATEGWRDIAPLKKEFRESYKEFRDVLRRAKIVMGGK